MGKTTKTNTVKKVIKAAGVAVMVVLVLVAGAGDYEQATTANICRNINGNAVCYKP